MATYNFLTRADVDNYGSDLVGPSTKRSGYPRCGSGQHLASVLQERRENANIDAGFGIHLENLGSHGEYDLTRHSDTKNGSTRTGKSLEQNVGKCNGNN